MHSSLLKSTRVVFVVLLGTTIMAWACGGGTVLVESTPTPRPGPGSGAGPPFPFRFANPMTRVGVVGRRHLFVSRERGEAR